jgi:type IV secretion system protein TrbG
MKSRILILTCATCAIVLSQPNGQRTPDLATLKRIAQELIKDQKEVPAPPPASLAGKAAPVFTEIPEQVGEKLSVAAQKAVATAEPWKNDVQTPAAGKDGRVLYTFGEGLATVVCAPLRLCVLELQPGEVVLGEPHIGDSVRWSVSPAVSGTGSSVVNLVVIKPKEVNLDTNLMVPTNRRNYYLRLVSRPIDYVPLVAFTYPDDEAARWKQAAAVQERTKQEFEASNLAPIESVANLNFDYTITGGTEFLRPLRVVDDGHKTFIQMPAGTAVREAPVLVVAGLDSTAEMVNYRVKGNMYIVDRLFDHGALLLGAGKKQVRVDIVRAGMKPPTNATNRFGLKPKPDAIGDAYWRLRRPPPQEATVNNSANDSPKQ